MPQAPETKPTAGPEEPTARPFPIVGIGASAGGLVALEELIARLASDGMAYVVLQHLAPEHESALTEILARKTPLKVATIQDGMTVETNVIYVAPPKVDVIVEAGILRIMPSGERGPPNVINAFFKSLALDRGPAAIGVVLSGAGSDGTVGLKAIQADGGITFAQDPVTAGQGSMPQAALDAGAADFCLSPAEIGDELMRLSAHPFVARKRPRALFDAEALGQVFAAVRRAFGVDFSAYKVSTIERRIERRMALQKLDKVEAYLKLLDTNPQELSVLYSDLLIGVTGFFRDKEPFEALQSVVLPRLLEKRSHDLPIRVWVAGCATGEEAYSVAICLLENLGDQAAGFKIQIFATDIDDASLAKARLGLYPKSIEVDVSPARLQRFFTVQDKGYQIARQLRDLVVFARHNLGKDPPFSRLDLITCRNVLIYMQPPLQRKVLRIFHYALKPDAFLLLGTSESVGDAADLFSLTDRRLKVYARKNAFTTTVFDLPSSRGAGPGVATASLGPAEPRPQHSLQQLADRKVIERYGPPGVLLSEKLEVLQFRGKTSPYLEPSPGAATLGIFKLVRPELLVALRAAIQSAATTGLPATASQVSFWSGKDTSVTIDVVPLSEAQVATRCLLVTFREAPPTPAPAQPAMVGDVEPGPADGMVQTLQRELLTTKEYLQTIVQELEGTNEELQSSNEELQSSNEELQSSNEELETSKEELQSTNEELTTVNEELRVRMSQLNLSNDDLNNVMLNVNTPIVIVGMDLRMRRFSAGAERLLSLRPGDEGRPVAYLGSVVGAPQIEQLVAECINTIAAREHRVRCSDSNWYTLRAVPYRTGDHAIRGAVVELTRAPPLLRKLGEPLEIHELVGRVLSTLPHALVLLDGLLRLVWVNQRFFEAFGVGAEVLGHTLDEVWPAREEHHELWSLLEGVVAGGPSFEGVAVARPFGRPDDRPLRFSARGIAADGDRPALTLLVIEEAPSQGVPA